MEHTGGTSRNLAVVVGNWIDHDYARVYPLVQEFLHDQYLETLALLAKHRSLLDLITETLMRDPLIDQDQLLDICREAGVVTMSEELSAA